MYSLFQVPSIQNENTDPIPMFRSIRGEIQTTSTEQTEREICKWLRLRLRPLWRRHWWGGRGTVSGAVEELARGQAGVGWWGRWGLKVTTWLPHRLLCSAMSDSDPCTVAHQAPLSMGFSRQEYWSGLWLAPPEDSSLSRDQTLISCVDRWILYHWTTWKPKLI